MSSDLPGPAMAHVLKTELREFRLHVDSRLDQLIETAREMRSAHHEADRRVNTLEQWRASVEGSNVDARLGGLAAKLARLEDNVRGNDRKLYALAAIATVGGALLSILARILPALWR